MLHSSKLVALWSLLVLLPITVFAQPAELGAADLKRIEQLQEGGYQVTGEHVVMWFPMMVSRTDAENLRDGLDRAVGEARHLIGTQPWQKLGTRKITYYFPNGDLRAHGTGLGLVFIPTALLQQPSRAPLLYRGVVELLTPTRQLPLDNSADGKIFRPNVVESLLSGLTQYIALTASERTGFGELGEYELGRLRDINVLCVTRVRATGPSAILPYVGAAGRPMWGADETKYQPAFQACSTSFTKFLIDQTAFDRVLGVIPYVPDGSQASLAEIERITGHPITTLQTEWQRTIGAP